MYLKLGNITVNRLASVDDFTIFVEVVDSTMSFEHPVFVRNSDQLDIWFGRNFSDRDYFVELLDRGVSLYLYKPISIKSDSPDYIDLEEFPEYSEEVLYYSVNDLPTYQWYYDYKYNVNGTYYVFADYKHGYVPITEIGKYVDKPKEYLAQYQFREFASPSSLPEVGQEGIKYRVLDPGVWYIWLHDSWVPENELPQNLINESVSLNNRDVLAITDPSVKNLPEFFYPEYKEFVDNDEHLGLFSISERELPEIIIDEENLARYSDTNELVNINSSDILEGDSTLAIREIYIGNINGSISEGFQLVRDMTQESIENTIITRDSGAIVYNGILLPSDLYSKRSYVANILELKSLLQELGYGVEVVDSGKEIAVYSHKAFDLTYLNTLKEIKVENDQILNNQLLTQMFMPFVSLEMWSKTIGREDEEYEDNKNIKVKINRIGAYEYRIVISRYDYSESFEGTLFPKPGKQRLDDLISNNSNLVYCKIKQNIETLREGEYILRGATIEKQNKDMYWKSLNTIFEEEIFPDYLLVPDISKYANSLDSDYSYYKEYKTFLDIAKEHNLQVLIQNSDSKFKLEEVDALPEEQSSDTVYKVGSRYYLNGEEISDQDFITLVTAGNDYIFNYSGDKENRLIYFFRDMTSYLKKRPGYYIYLSGLLNNVFSATPDNIVYNSPISYPYDLDQKVVKVDELPRTPKVDTIYILGEDYYLGPEKITDDKLIQAANEVEIKERLSSYKSNYLVYNNQMYYYRGYENGEDYETTAWMRFAIGKIYRELQKNKWNYLSLKNVGKIRENIVSILSRISRNYSIIKTINISVFKPVMSENRIELTLDIGVSDLVFAENNIVLDLIINYIKEN